MGSVVIFLTLLSITSFAVTETYKPAEKLYESENAEHDISSRYSVSMFCFGEKSVGSFAVDGSIHAQSTINGFTAYSVSDAPAIQYSYTTLEIHGNTEAKGTNEGK